LSREELADALERSLLEVGKNPAITLLHRAGTFLEEMDAAGFVEVLPPHPDDPAQNPRSRIDWAGSLAALQDRAGGNVLRIAASLVGELAVDLSAELSMMDRRTTALVLAAINASTQSHSETYERLLPDGRPSGWSGSVSREPLFPWPPVDPEPADVQGSLSLWPAAEEEAAAEAAALANPYPEVGLPLDDHVRRVLRHLRPADWGGMRGGGLHRRRFDGEPGVRQSMHEHPRPDVEAWLGFRLPEFDGVGRLMCLTFEEPPLAERGSLLPHGEPAQFHIGLLWVPDGTDLDRVQLHHAAQDGLLSGGVNWSPWERPHEEDPPTSFREAAGGFTGVTVRGTRVGVQRRDPAETRIGWLKEASGTRFGVHLNVPREPEAALEFLLAGRGAP
jgi:hypothetical protein